MRPAAKLAGFTLVLGVAFGGGAALGSLVGPIDAEDDQDTSEHDEHHDDQDTSEHDEHQVDPAAEADEVDEADEMDDDHDHGAIIEPEA